MLAISTPSSRRWPVRPAVLLLSLLALVPVAFIAITVAAASRNIVFWDEFDTVLDLLLKLDAGLNGRAFLESLFAINNEHRMITSRLMYAASWWLTGTVDFRVFGVIGNLFLPLFCVVLVVAAGSTERRVRLGVILAALMFQLGHHENLLWAGASIDHFQVVALAVGAIVLVNRGGRWSLLAAAGLAGLATFTLAHGLMTWPVGAWLLWRERRWRALGGWAVAMVVAAGAFFYGFEINSGHRMAGFDVPGLANMGRYWLALLGMPVVLGKAALAPYAGGVLLVVAGWLGWQGAWRRERMMAAVGIFGVGALVLIAVGRSEVSGGLLQSRYVVLSALAWSVTLFVTLEHLVHPLRPFRLLTACLPVLVAFNVAADLRFAPEVESFVEGRDGAALRYKQYGREGHSPFRLYPVPERATQLLHAAEQKGIYRIPRLCVRTNVEDLQPSNRIAYFVDEMTADTNATYVSGWAAVPNALSRRGQIHLVFRSAKSFIIYNTLPMSRPDVAASFGNPNWRMSGFRLAIGRWRLPPEELQVGIIIKDGDKAEFIMTEHRLRPYGRGEALLANSQ